MTESGDQSAVGVVRDLPGPFVLTDRGLCMVLGGNTVGPGMTQITLGALLGLFASGVISVVF